MDNFIIWDAVSMAWTEVGLDSDEYTLIASSLKENYPNWKEIDKVILGDVCWSFSVESTVLLLALIPFIGLFISSPFPDWGYEEEYLRKRIKNWNNKSLIIKLINPLRIIGYPISLIFMYGLRSKLKRAYHSI